MSVRVTVTVEQGNVAERYEATGRGDFVLPVLAKVVRAAVAGREYEVKVIGDMVRSLASVWDSIS